MTSPVREKLSWCTFTHGGATYTIPYSGHIERIPFQDSPPVSPSSGAAQVSSRPEHNIVVLQNIISAFAHEIEHEFGAHGGIIDHLASSLMDTRWRNGIWFLPAENNPTMPADTGTSYVAVGSTGAAQVGGQTRPNKNPKTAVFFVGSTNTGVFTWRTDDVNASSEAVDALRWSGTVYSEEAQIISSANVGKAGRDMVTHKAVLAFLLDDRDSGASRATVYTSSNGDTFSAMSNHPAGGCEDGSRLYDDGATLRAFLNRSDNTWDQMTTTDSGGTAWSAAGTDYPGQVRDVETFFDLDGNAQIVILTESHLYWLDTSNNVVEELLALPARGRAMIRARVNEKPGLLVFMDAMRVLAYFADGSYFDMSPGGGDQGMPSGFDFGPDASGQVQVTRGPAFIYALWSGADTAGSAQKPLCLAFDGRVEFDAEGHIVSAGWHTIWQKADTSVSFAARMLAYDPVSGDLLMAVQDATGESTTLVQLKDIEVNPLLQATLDRKTSGELVFARQDFGTPMVSTTLWDIFLHTSGLGTNKSIAVSYRTNGSTGAYTTVGSATTTDNDTLLFPDDSASAAGLNVRDVQIKLTFAANAATDVIRLFSASIGYRRVWPIRYIHSIPNVVVDAAGKGVKGPDGVLTDISSILAVTTKGALTYNGSTYYVIPTLDSRVNEIAAEATREKRTGNARLVFFEA